MIAIRRSPEFFVSDERLGKVRVADESSWLVVRTRPAASVGIVGKATRDYEAVPVMVTPVTVYSPAALKVWSPVSACHP